MANDNPAGVAGVLEVLQQTEQFFKTHSFHSKKEQIGQAIRTVEAMAGALKAIRDQSRITTMPLSRAWIASTAEDALGGAAPAKEEPKCDCGSNADNRWPHHDECALFTTPAKEGEDRARKLYEPDEYADAFKGREQPAAPKGGEDDGVCLCKTGAYSMVPGCKHCQPATPAGGGGEIDDGGPYNGIDLYGSLRQIIHDAYQSGRAGTGYTRQVESLQSLEPLLASTGSAPAPSADGRLMQALLETLRRYQDGRVFSNPHTWQVARAIEQEARAIAAAPTQEPQG